MNRKLLYFNGQFPDSSELENFKDDFHQVVPLSKIFIDRSVTIRRLSCGYWIGYCNFHCANVGARSADGGYAGDVLPAQDSNQSFVVNDNLNSYCCFACGAFGDVFSLVKKSKFSTNRQVMQSLLKEYEGVFKRMGEIELWESLQPTNYNRESDDD